jgi:hypothetical protein
MAAEPNLVADNDDKLPIKLPIGVLTALTITTFLLICYYNFCYEKYYEQIYTFKIKNILDNYVIEIKQTIFMPYYI